MEELKNWYLNRLLPSYSELTKKFPQRSIMEFTLSYDRIRSTLEDASTFRAWYIDNIAFPLYTKEEIDTIADMLAEYSAVVEVGSGIGYFARLMHDRGINILSCDNLSGRYTKGERGWQVLENRYSLLHLESDGLQDIPGCGVVVLSWPDYDNDTAINVWNAMSPGQVLLYQGEWGGCTANETFHKATEEYIDEEASDSINRFHVTFEFLHDRWYVINKE